jgi:hypothetical protein
MKSGGGIAFHSSGSYKANKINVPRTIIIARDITNVLAMGPSIPTEGLK